MHNKTHRSPLCLIFPFLSQSTKLVSGTTCPAMPFQWSWLWISVLSPSGGITKRKVFPSLPQKSAFRSDDAQSPSVWCPTMHGPLQTPTSSYAFPCVSSYFPHKTNFSLKPLTLQVSLCPHSPPLSHYTWLHQPAPSDRERLKGFGNKWVLLCMELCMCYDLASTAMLDFKWLLLRDTGSQFTFTSLQAITEKAHAHTHTSLMKTTFVPSCLLSLTQ